MAHRREKTGIGLGNMHVIGYSSIDQKLTLESNAILWWIKYLSRMRYAKKVRLALALLGNAQTKHRASRKLVIDLSIHTPVSSIDVVDLHIGLVSISNHVLSRRSQNTEKNRTINTYRSSMRIHMMT